MHWTKLGKVCAHTLPILVKSSFPSSHQQYKPRLAGRLLDGPGRIFLLGLRAAGFFSPIPNWCGARTEILGYIMVRLVPLSLGEKHEGGVGRDISVSIQSSKALGGSVPLMWCLTGSGKVGWLAPGLELWGVARFVLLAELAAAFTVVGQHWQTIFAFRIKRWP